MSSIDIYKVLAEFQGAWERLERDGIYDHLGKGCRHIIEPIVEHLREAEKSGYLGTLYRTDFEVEGVGEFPMDMLRYTSSWPTEEGDARDIENSFAIGSTRRKIRLSRHHRDPDPQIAADRWEAKFRWKVVRIVETVAL